MQQQMDKKNITIVIGVVIVLTVVLGVGIYLLVKQAPKINNQTKEDNSEQTLSTTDIKRLLDYNRKNINPSTNWQDIRKYANQV